MLDLIKHAPLFFLQPHFLEGVGTVSTFWIGSYFKWFRPMLKERQARERRDDLERDQVYGFVLGMPADSLRPEVIAAPIQMKHLTDAVGQLTVTVEEAKESNEAVAAGQAVIVAKMRDQTELVSTMNSSLTALDLKVSQVQTGTETLVHESKSNQGGSMRDAVDAQGLAIGEIQSEQTRVRDEKTKGDRPRT
jgi:hypothetical protein